MAIIFAIRYVPKQTLYKHRTDHRATTQTQRHLTRATQLLSRAKSNPQRDQSQTLAKTAIAEIEKALSLSPKDPTPHVLKSLALDLLGHKGSALRSLDLALASTRVKSLSEKERLEALLRRAELKLAVNKKRRVDSAVTDLEEAVKVSGEMEEGGIKTRAFCLLGVCYELKGMKDESRKAFEEALKVEPDSTVARQGLERIGWLWMSSQLVSYSHHQAIWIKHSVSCIVARLGSAIVCVSCWNLTASLTDVPRLCNCKYFLLESQNRSSRYLHW